jgi:hypothetical protein
MMTRDVRIAILAFALCLLVLAIAAYLGFDRWTVE